MLEDNAKHNQDRLPREVVKIPGDNAMDTALSKQL